MKGNALHRNSDTQTRIDPVCGMEASVHSDYKATFSGREFSFCSETCREHFQDDPEDYVTASPEPGVLHKVKPVEPGGHVPQQAIEASKIQRSQMGSKPQPPGARKPDAYGEEVMDVEDPPDDVVREGLRDDNVMPG